MARHSRKKIMHALAGIAGLGKTPSAAIPERLKKAYGKADDATKAAVMEALKAFLPPPGVSPTERKKAREVVNQFVMGKSASHGEIESTGTQLKVKGNAVATRASTTSKMMTVCPGKFGGDKESRNAANAVLDLVHAGIKVGDREAMAFLEPHVGGKSRRGRIESTQVCYQVEVPSAIVKAIGRAEDKARYSPEAVAAAYASMFEASERYASGARASAAKASSKKRPAEKKAARKGKRK